MKDKLTWRGHMNLWKGSRIVGWFVWGCSNTGKWYVEGVFTGNKKGYFHKEFPSEDAARKAIENAATARGSR